MKKFLFIPLLWVAQLALAQIEITFPSERTVIQRNKNNEATLHITGTFGSELERIEARLVAIQGGNNIDWTEIVRNPNLGFFKGSLNARGGWYRLEVRGIANGQVVTNATINRVGIGEVFLIAGQSNAQGYYNSGNPSASDDRVNCITNFIANGSPIEPDFPTFSKVNFNTHISPTGSGSWCWGKLGDLLAQKLNVPILFMNAGSEAMSVVEWRLSADGARGYNPYVNNYAPAGFPYQPFKQALNYYVNLLGIRGILWLQGETDTYSGTSTQMYRESLQFLIERSRQNSGGKNISWVISRTSKDQYRGTAQRVIDGQNQVIQQTPNTFAGPETDNIGPRTDNVHFYGQGLIDLAEAWNRSLDNAFFANSIPYQGTAPLELGSNCNTSSINQPINLSMPTGFSSYKWNTGDSNFQIRVGQGTYKGYAKDAQGNVYFTPQISLPSQLIPERPTISANRSTTLCQGESVSLSSNYNSRNYWNNSEVGKTINVNQGGTFQVSHVNLYGCVATSNGINVNVNPLPEAKITADGSTEFCSDKSIRLTSSGNNNTWSNGQTSKTITVNNSGDYNVTVTNEFGCKQTSSPIKVTVRPSPNPPVITSDRNTTFCNGESVRLTSNVDVNEWSSGSKDRTITVNTPGDYFVTTTNEFGCKRQSNITKVVVNPLPEKPIVTTNGATVFCSDKSVTLTSNIVNGNRWNNGVNSRTITTSQSGEYFTTVLNEFGCANSSIPISIKVNSQPPKPSIFVDGQTTICSDQTTILTATPNQGYLWSNGEKSQRIRVNQEGNYTAKVIDQNGCESPASNPIYVTVRAAPEKPSISQTGTYTIEATTPVPVGSVYEWNLEGKTLPYNSPVIKARQVGFYSLKVMNTYTLPNNTKLTCASPLSSTLSFYYDLQQKGMAVYPNPTPLGKVYIETLDDFENAKVLIYTTKGEKVSEIDIPKFDIRKEIDLTNFTKGEYLIAVKARNYEAVKKVLVE